MGELGHRALNFILIFLAILIAILIIVALILRKNLSDCERQESPFCLQYLCASGNPAERTDDKGNKVFSGQ